MGGIEPFRIFIQKASLIDQIIIDNPGIVAITATVQISYEFRDVFGIKCSGESYFLGGIFKREATQKEIEAGESVWGGEFIPVAKPADWPKD
jgi:hypothetical protein